MKVRTQVLEKAVEFAATVGHLSRPSFKMLLEDKAERTERLRWRELQSSGFFSEPKFIDHFEFLALTKEGLTFARSIGLNPALVTSRSQVLHDEIAARFSMWMEREKLVTRWQPEIQLKKSRTAEGLLFTQGKKRKFPDVLFDLNVPGPTVRFALEVELTLKTRRRYRELLHAYTTVEGFDSILFVTRNGAIANAIRETMTEIRFPESRLTVLFSTLNEVTTDPSNALFRARHRVWTMPSLVQMVSEKRARVA